MENLREIKQGELEELKTFVSKKTHFARIMMFFIILLFPSMLFYTINMVISRFHFWPIPVILIAYWLGCKFIKWSGGKEFRKLIKEDISGGKVRELSYLVKRALTFAELEDEGNTYFVEDEDGKVIYFSGQELPKKFPRKTITVSQAPKSEYIFKISTKGESIKLAKTAYCFHEDVNYSNEIANKTYSEVDLDFNALLKRTKGDEYSDKL